MEDIILQTKDLSFSYEEQQVLKKINVSICRGERVAVMGSNGAGKSTFFLNLNGVLQPDAGEIILNGKVLGKRDFKELRQKVGFVFQDADSQIIASNVRAEISFGPMNLGLTREQVIRRVDEAVSYLSLEELEKRAPQYLSGGEKKRVSIADILAMEPEVLIFDEPMAALDPVNAHRVEEILNRLHEEGKTLIVATHDVDFAYRFADRILVICEGKVLAEGTPYEIFHRQEVLEKSHLRCPAVLTVWEALLDAHMVSDTGKRPVTPQELAENLQIYK